jgi:phosphocarrier protein
MNNKDVTIINKLGLHARAAAKLVQVASGFEADIRLLKDSQEVNGKSIMGVMMLAAGRGTKIEIVATGRDEQVAIDKIAELIANRFGEEE